MVSLEELNDRTSEWLSQGSFPYAGAPETLTRQYLLHPLFTLLNWSDSPRDEFHYISEYKGSMNRKWEDLVLMKKDMPLVFIECKNLLTDEILTTNNINELLNYMKEYNRTNKEGYRVDWGVLTNYKELHIFYVSDNTPFVTLNYSSYIDNAAFLNELISVEGIKKDGLAHNYSENKKEELGELFLRDLKKWRLIIANGCYDFDNNLTIDQIKNVSQQYLDRFIFIRMLETLGILPYNWLRSIYLRWQEGIMGLNKTFSEVIREQFITIESLYDTELFSFTLTDEIDINDNYLKELMKVEQILDPTVARKIGVTGSLTLDDKGLYGYSFKTLSIDIIGSAYERYLAHEINIIDNSIRIMDTAALRKKEGIYYTPNYIVKYIAKNTVNQRLNEILQDSINMIHNNNYGNAKDKINEIKSIKILDPACGSGSFLIEIFDILYDTYLNYNHMISESISEIQTRRSIDQYIINNYETYLVDFIGESILLDNLYGVDLDPQAVEITKLNLWLKMLSRAPNKYRPLFEVKQKKLLPSLDLKIKCGNSLVFGITQEQLSEQEIINSLNVINELRSSILSLVIKTTPSYDSDSNLLLILDETKELLNQLASLNTNVFSQLNERLIEDNYFDMENDEYIGLSGNPFNWEAEFPEIFENGGFDIIVGNPPHGAALSSEERNYISDEYVLGRGKKNTAYIFIELCAKKLRNNGKIGLVIPKSLLFSQEWEKVRNYLLENFRIEEIVDISKAFKGVLLEQVILLVTKSSRVDYFKGLEMNIDGEIIANNIIQIGVCENMNSFPILCDSQDMAIFNKIMHDSMNLGNISKTCRGFPFQRHLLDTCSGDECEETLKGKDIKRYNYSDPEWFLNRDLMEGRNKYDLLKRDKIIAQRIVAHIENPVDHIAIMAAHDTHGYVNVDTVENITLTDEHISPYYILGFLNSRLIGWFVYKFIFCNAIRTMDFDEYYVDKIPYKEILTNTENDIEEIIELVTQNIIICQQKNWLYESYNALLQVYQLIDPVSIQYFLEPSRAIDYHFDLTSILRLSPEVMGTITHYDVTMYQNRISLKVQILESPDPLEGISFIINDNDVRNYIYLTLKNNAGNKNYRRSYSIIGKIFDDFKIPLTISRAAEANISTFNQLLEYLNTSFNEKIVDNWAQSPMQDFDPAEINNAVESFDDAINLKIYDLFSLSQDEIEYIKSQSPKLTRLI